MSFRMFLVLIDMGLFTVLAYGFFNASVVIHERLLTGIFRTKMAFFDVKPLGMILNRFSKDLDVIGKTKISVARNPTSSLLFQTL